jgi:hypothetical protein
VVSALCRALLKEVNGETKERRFLKLLGKGYIDSENVAPLIAQFLSELDGAAQPAAASTNLA